MQQFPGARTGVPEGFCMQHGIFKSPGAIAHMERLEAVADEPVAASSGSISRSADKM
jgi:hypothetical protein